MFTPTLRRSVLVLALVACSEAAPPRDHDGHAHRDPTGAPDPEEPYDPNADDVGRRLPRGTDVRWPQDRYVDATFADLEALGGVPSVTYDQATPVMQSLLPLGQLGIQRRGRDWWVDVEIGDVWFTVATRRGVGRGALLLVDHDAPAVLGLLKRYEIDPTNGRTFLGLIAVVDPAGPGPAPFAQQAFTPTSAPAPDCEALAWAEVGPMPWLTVVFPPLSGCDLDDCVDAKAAWIRANHDVYRVRQMLEAMNGMSDARRAWLWSQQGKAPDGTPAGERTSMVYWWGGYADYRFDAIRWAYNRLWSNMHDLDLEGTKLDHTCRPSSGADICNTAEPAAHHAVKSNVKLCDRFFDDKGDNDRARLMVHEHLHHVFVPWNNGSPRLDPIMDTHTHGHGELCAWNIITDKGYGEDKVRELATYTSQGGKVCWHRNYAFRNNDSYALAAMNIGRGVREGTTVSWPFDWYGPGQEPGGYPPPDPCQGYGGGLAQDGWGDPLHHCEKIGGELVCHGGGGGAPHPMTELTWECPEPW